jgi:spore maturation protein CgeB
MKVLCVFGEHQYGDSSRGLSTEYAAFVPALRNLGHEVRHFESWNRALYRDLGDLNRKLLEVVEEYRPDVMLTVQMFFELWLETLDLIRSRGDVATISWATDDSWKYREVSRFIGHSYDAMTTTYDYVIPRYHEDGIEQVLLTQWAVSSEWLSSPLPAGECRYAVSFVGAAHGDRPDVVRRLQAQGIEVVCFGHGWPRGSVAAEEIPRIMRESIISLNFPNSKGADQIKARTFEVPGAGGFLLTGNTQGLERFYMPGAEIATFDDFDGLVQAIRHFLAHPEERDRTAHAGHRRTRAEHTYEHRMAQVLDFARAARGSSVRLPGKSLEDAEKAHALTPVLQASRFILLGLCSIFFGSSRAPRAARRLLFELSWRIAGRSTFTAAGLPGRLFPRD